MPQCVSEMVQVSNFYLQRGAAKILNKALLKFGRKPIRIRIRIYLLARRNLLWDILTWPLYHLWVVWWDTANTLFKYAVSLSHSDVIFSCSGRYPLLVHRQWQCRIASLPDTSKHDLLKFGHLHSWTSSWLHSPQNKMPTRTCFK